MHCQWLAGKNNFTLPALALGLLAFASPTKADNDLQRRAPELPAPACDHVNVRAGHRLSFRAYALGVQIYRWTGNSWEFVAPDATLFADPCYNGSIGLHYAGPTWEASDGSKVVAARVADCTPSPGAIPWLLLAATPISDHGLFSGVTYIQRLNTIGGTAPAAAGTFVGEEARVPYTAEYYFYRETQP